MKKTFGSQKIKKITIEEKKNSSEAINKKP